MAARPESSRDFGICSYSVARVLAMFLATGPVRAQHVDDNAVVAADDAFGLAVGTESVGLYTPDQVRGFNPQTAGNVRIGGLSFDVTASSYGRRAANLANTLSIPSTQTVDIGSRYQFKLSNANASLRLFVLNIANTYQWNLTEAGEFSRAPSGGGRRALSDGGFVAPKFRAGQRPLPRRAR